jgi:hypothetical protein
MEISKLFQKHSIVSDTYNAAQRRRLALRRLDVSMATFVSPIERWADKNYAPYDLDYLYTQKSQVGEIVAPLHGYQAKDVHVDIAHGNVIILLSLEGGSAYQARQEYYCEVPLQPDFNFKDAYLEVGPFFLTVYLIQGQSVYQRAVSMACRLKPVWLGS